MMKQLKQVGNWRQFQLNSKYRSGIRTLNRIVLGRLRETFSRLRSTRVIIGYVRKLKDVFRMLGVVQLRNVRYGFVGMYREMLRNKKAALSE
jgi:hypothetical protein